MAVAPSGRMSFSRGGVWVAAVVFVGSASADSAPGYDPMMAELGKPIFQRYCTSCHGPGGRGNGPTAVTLRKPPADLTAIAKRRGGEFPAGEIAQFIDGRFAMPAHGSREMPVWGERFGADIPDSDSAESIARGNIATLVEYLKSIQQPPLAAQKPARK
jgi:mono/diheme cytochrome c family protein